MNQTMLNGIQKCYFVVVTLSIFGVYYGCCYGVGGRGVMANIVIDGRSDKIGKTMQD